MLETFMALSLLEQVGVICLSLVSISILGSILMSVITGALVALFALFKLR